MLTARKALEYLDACTHPHMLLVLFCLSVSSIVFLLAPDNVKKTVSSDYEPQVENLLAGRGFVSDHGTVMCRYPPAYPLMLASIRFASQAIGVSLSLLLFMFSAASILASCLLVYGIARLVIPGPGAIASALLFAIHPQVLYGTLIPLSETPFVAVFLAAVYCCLLAVVRRPPQAGILMLLSGALCGLAILTRPAALLTPVVMAGAALLLGAEPLTSRLRHVGALLLGSLLALSVWEVFVWQRSGSIVLVSSGGVPTMRDGFTFNHKGMRSPIWLPAGVRWLSDGVWSRYPDLRSFSDIASLLREKARERPFAVAQTYLFKAGRSWYGTDSQKWRLELLNAFLALAYMVPAAIGVWHYGRGRPKAGNAGLLLVVLVFYFWGMTTAFLSIARYMTPAIGLLSPFIPFALVHNQALASRHRNNALANA